MHIMHVALGGCLRPPPVRYGITQDTGGHIAYLLGAADAQARSPDVRVSLVTRGFHDASLGADHALARQRVGPRVEIRRLFTARTGYLSKQALSDELGALTEALLQLAIEDRPDVIHAHFADAADIALTVRSQLRIPVLYTPHSLALQHPSHVDGEPVLGELARRLARETRAIREADAIIVSSSDEAYHQVGAYDDGAHVRTVVARPGVALVPGSGTAHAQALIDPCFHDPSRPLLLAVARPVAKKNLTSLVDAFARDDRLRARCNLAILAGQHASIRSECDEQSDQLDALHRAVDTHGLHGLVALPAAHDADHVAQLYRLCAQRRGVFVNPAFHEPFGLTLVEAARHGVPVIATNRGGPADIVATIGHGLTVDPDSVTQIADACAALLFDRRAYARARRSAQQRNGKYRWEGWAATVADVIRDLPLRRSARTVRCELPRLAHRGCAVDTTAADYLLAFDIDDTLTGSQTAVERFVEWYATRSAERLPVAFATGREVPEAMAVLQRWRLPRPDVWLTSVGTEIWRNARDGALERCEAYAQHLALDWNRDDIVRLLSPLSPRFQPAFTQRDFKISLFGDAACAERVQDVLHADGLQVRVVASHGRFIDILPACAGKAAAIAFEGQRRGVPLERCVAAGNSGNDEDMLLCCGRAILVANALPELSGLPDRPGLYRARRAFADGVLEGLGAHRIIEPTRREVRDATRACSS